MALIRYRGSPSAGQPATLYAPNQQLLELRTLVPTALADETVGLEAKRVTFVRRDRCACMAFCLSARPTPTRLPVPVGIVACGERPGSGGT